MIFESMLRAELTPETTVRKFILSPDPKEMGVACGKIYLDAEEGQEGVAFVVVADFALPTDPAVFVLGNVYMDLNGDHLYNSGEGIEGLTVSVGAFGEEGCGRSEDRPPWQLPGGSDAGFSGDCSAGRIRKDARRQSFALVGKQQFVDGYRCRC